VSDDATVFVVDDDPEVGKALERLLRSAGMQARVCRSAHDFLAAADRQSSGCIILDYEMPGLDGLELQRVLAARGSGWQIVFLTGHGDVPKSVRAMKEGAVDFLQKPAGQDEILGAVRRALARGARECAKLAEAAEARLRWSHLTPREREVMGYVIAGRLNKQIAGILGTAEKTVKIQRAAVMQKMGVRSVADLVRSADKAGVVPS
jgi:FixJ family two-component response regulator